MVAPFIHAARGPERGRVEITGRILRTTGKAQLVQTGVYPHLVETWLPREAIEIRANRDGSVAVLMSRNLAARKGFITPRLVLSTRKRKRRHG